MRILTYCLKSKIKCYSTLGKIRLANVLKVGIFLYTEYTPCAVDSIRMDAHMHKHNFLSLYLITAIPILQMRSLRPREIISFMSYSLK